MRLRVATRRAIEQSEPSQEVIRDTDGNVLLDNDTAVVMKTMTTKGAPCSLKAGTKVKNIRLVGGDHDNDC